MKEEKKDWRMSISLTREMAEAIYNLRMQEQYTRMSYTEIIRRLVQLGLDNIDEESRPA